MFKFNFRNTKIRVGSIRTYDILVLLEWMIPNVWNIFNDKDAKTTSMKAMSSHISENWWKRQKYVGITDMIIDTQARFFSMFFVFFSRGQPHETDISYCVSTIWTRRSPVSFQFNPIECLDPLGHSPRSQRHEGVEISKFSRI